MYHPACILIYGTDQLLLETRCKVLETAGHQATAVNDVFSLQPYSSGMTFDLLVLCHSLSPDDCRRITSLARARWPGISTIVLTRGRFTNPGALLAHVHEVLAERPNAGSDAAPTTELQLGALLPNASRLL